ncbi:acyl carrier protein [Maridesulfovibrio sp.]|uniref:acyl carrier protein n=1 Tax=Maridesulfovibrio sp. TaxID=2795000 RepID=UPI002A18BD3D|nr:acyl carrier protein [Maridesulfovibrio sp.]
MEKKIMDILKKYGTVGSDHTITTPYTEVQGWDSMKHVQFILDVEAEFNIKMKPEQLVLATNIERTIRAIEEC